MKTKTFHLSGNEINKTLKKATPLSFPAVKKVYKVRTRVLVQIKRKGEIIKKNTFNSNSTICSRSI